MIFLSKKNYCINDTITIKYKVIKFMWVGSTRGYSLKIGTGHHTMGRGRSEACSDGSTRGGFTCPDPIPNQILSPRSFLGA